MATNPNIKSITVTRQSNPTKATKKSSSNDHERRLQQWRDAKNKVAIFFGDNLWCCGQIVGYDAYTITINDGDGELVIFKGNIKALTDSHKVQSNLIR